MNLETPDGSPFTLEDVERWLPASDPDIKVGIIGNYVVLGSRTLGKWTYKVFTKEAWNDFKERAKQGDFDL